MEVSLLVLPRHTNSASQDRDYDFDPKGGGHHGQSHNVSAMQDSALLEMEGLMVLIHHEGLTKNL